jgi:hypothetical protein
MGYPAIRSNRTVYRARGASDGEQPILATSPVRPLMPDKKPLRLLSTRTIGDGLAFLTYELVR